MSWDVFIQRKDAESLPIGTLTDVQALISTVFPSTDWSDASWGVYESDEGSIEFNIGKKPIITGFMLHIRRASDATVPKIIELCQRNSLLAVDCGSGEFLE